MTGFTELLQWIPDTAEKRGSGMTCHVKSLIYPNLQQPASQTVRMLYGGGDKL